MNLWSFISSLLIKEPDKLFHEGQEITMIMRGNWVQIETRNVFPGPKFGEIVKCGKYQTCTNNIWYISISGYNGSFREDHFAPVISDDQLEEMLNDIDELVIKQHAD